MPDNIVTQNIRQNQYQLKRISELTELTESFENLNNILNNSYLLITNQELANNYKIKCSLFLDKISERIENIIEELDNSQQEILDRITILIDKINAISDRINDLYTRHVTDAENYQSQIDLLNSHLSTSYYNKDDIRLRIDSMKGELNDELLEYFENVINEKINTEVTEQIANDINDIKAELNTNNNTIYPNSRIDKIEAKIKYLEENGGFNPIDTIDRIEWLNYGIINQKSQYTINEVFEINKGNVIVYYNDNTSEDITNNAIFNITGGTLADNVVTIGSLEGNYHISVSYEGHEATNKISYKAIAPKYYSYFLFVDDTNLNNVYDFENNINHFDEYYINKKDNGCPMIEEVNYNALSIIIEKFYGNVDTNLRDEHLYLILAKEYCEINNTKLYINDKPLKSNIFEISGINIKQEIMVEEQCHNIQGYDTKTIPYYILEITDSINNGIQLKY